MTGEQIDYASLKSLAIEMKRPGSTLYVLSAHNDPFMAGTPGRRSQADWFHALWHGLGFGSGVHLRRVHYRLISQNEPIRMLDGAPYENTQECWQKLGEAARDARYLRLVPAAAFVDRRTELPVINLAEPSGASVDISSPDLADVDLPDRLPEPPRLDLDAPVIPQHYHVEIWAEKSTMDDVLRPLEERYQCNLVQGAGEQSLTRCDELVERAKESGRPVRLLYVSDFDPAGMSMPVAVARKIEHRLRTDNLDLNIQLRPIVLTADQCREYRLPRAPIKESERRGARFEARHGEGATELDALEALHPGALREILEADLDRYFDGTLDDRVEEAAEDLQGFLDKDSDEAADEHVGELEALNDEYRELRERLDAEFKRIGERLKAAHRDVESRLATVDTDYEWPEPKQGDEDPDPLYDSTREYVEQCDRFKQHQGKPTARRGNGCAP